MSVNWSTCSFYQFLFLVLSIVESARVTCIVPKDDQQRCGGVSASLSKNACENLGCCYNDAQANNTIACYKKGFVHLTHIYQFENRKMFCDRNTSWRKKSCFAQKVNKFTCLWFDCCWDQASQSCYEPFVDTCGSSPEAPDHGHGPTISSQTVQPPLASPITATYSCDPGFVLLPPSGMLICDRSNESWKPNAVSCEDPTCFLERKSTSVFSLRIPSRCRRFHAAITIASGPPLVIYAAKGFQDSLVNGDFCEIHEGKTVLGRVIGRLHETSGPFLVHNSDSVYLDCKTSNSDTVELIAFAYNSTYCGTTQVNTFPSRIAPPAGSSGNYTGLTLCRWNVTSRVQRSFRLDFADFNIRTKDDALYILSNDPEQPTVRLDGNLSSFTQSISGSRLQMYFISPFPGIAPPFTAVVKQDPVCFSRQSSVSGVPLTVPSTCQQYQSVITLTEAPPLVIYCADDHRTLFLNEDFCEVHAGETLDGRVIGRLDANSGPVVVDSSRSFLLNCKTNNSGPIPIGAIAYKPSICGTTFIKTFPATIQPPAGAYGNYTGRTLCQWILTTGWQTSYTFNFTSFRTRQRADALYIVSDDPDQSEQRLSGELGSFSRTVSGRILQVYFITLFPGISAPFSAIINQG